MKDSRLQIELAEKTIEIYTDSAYLRKMCNAYITDREYPDFVIVTDEADIQYEKEKHLERNQTVNTKGREGVFESLAVYRKIADRMIACDTMLFHGSAVAVDGECYLFCADSGTGKSTHTRLWREYFKERAVMINDDKPLIQIRDDIRVFGTPWSGKHHLDTNTSAPLKAVCFLSRGKENAIRRIRKDEALPLLMQYAYRSENPDRLKRSVGLLLSMLDKIPMYALECNMEPEAAIVSYKGMQEGL